MIGSAGIHPEVGPSKPARRSKVPARAGASDNPMSIATETAIHICGYVFIII
jgi:hypothetical protein